MCTKKVIILCLSMALMVLIGSEGIRSVEGKETGRVICTGKVIDERGRPVAGARVSLRERIYGQMDRVYETRLAGEVLTKADGHFTFSEAAENDESVLVRYVVVEKEGLAPGFASWFPWEHGELEITLAQKMALAGIVVDESDRPIPQAVVSVYYVGVGEKADKTYPMSQLVPERSTAQTNEGGQFAFENLPAEAKVDFLLRKTGYATLYTYTTSRDMRYSAGQTDIKLVLVKEARIEGIVVEKDSAKPVPGITLEVRTEGNHSIVGQDPVSTGEDGTFSIDALNTGNYVVQLAQRLNGLAEWVAEPVKVTLEKGQVQKDLRIEACKGGFLEVHITDAQSKEPLAKAKVTIHGGGRTQWFYGRSDKNGVTRVRLMPGDYRINSLEKQGYTRKLWQSETITVEHGKTVRIEKQLAVAPKIVGVVRDEETRPVDGATVNVHPLGSRYDVITDAEGRYEVGWSTDVAVPPWYGPGRWLMARHEERNLAAIDEDVTEQTKTCDIEVKPGVMITGKVVDPDDKGIPSVNLRVNLQGPKWPTILTTDVFKTDENGDYEIRAVPAGQRGSVTAYAKGYGTIRTEFHADAAKDYHLALKPLTLAVANLSVSGRVTDLQGRPIPKAAITTDNREGQPERLYTQTDSQGRFTLSGVCEGKLNLRVDTVHSGKRLTANAITNGGARGITIIVREGRSAAQNLTVKTYDQIIGDSEKVIAGVALDENGLPVAGVPVGVYFRKKKRENGTFVYSRCSFDELSCTTDERGRFAIELKADGEHSLLVLPDHHASFIVYDIPAGKKDLKVTLPKGGTVRGRLVRVEEGKKVPIPNAEVRISLLERGAFTFLGPGSERTAITDTKGRFCFEHVRTKIRPSGSAFEEQWDYVARVWKISYGDTSRNIAFYDGTQIDDVELVVKPDSAEVKLRVGDALPGFEGIEIDLYADQAKDKTMLVCFFDMNQRPSRRYISEITKRAEQLGAKGVTIVAVQASKVEQNALDEWVKKYNVPFPVGMVQGDAEKVRFAWGVQSLPWLILTNPQHIITAEGFSMSELGGKVQEAEDAEQ